MKILSVSLCILLFIASAAFAHSWYPFGCCGDQDCRPVPCEELVEDKDGWLYVPTGNHFHPTQVSPSQDRHCHVCLGRPDGRSLCAFIVPSV